MGIQSQHDNQTDITRYTSNDLPMSERALAKLDANAHIVDSSTKSAIVSDSQMDFDDNGLHAVTDCSHDPLDAAFEAQHDPLDAAFETPQKCERRLTRKGKSQKKVSPKAATYRRSHGFCFPKTGTCQRNLKCAKYSITLEQL